MIFFTSDTHFSHERIISLCKRPFSSIQEMNEKITQNWNNTVKPSDSIYHLGDVIFSRDHSLLKRLNGNITFLKGNHDKYPSWKTLDYKEFKYYEHNFVLCHYPLLTWNKARYGSIHCHGHCHGSINQLNQNLKRFDVGVDVYNFTPVSIEQIIQEAKLKPIEDTRDY